RCGQIRRVRRSPGPPASRVGRRERGGRGAGPRGPDPRWTPGRRGRPSRLLTCGHGLSSSPSRSARHKACERVLDHYDGPGQRRHRSPCVAELLLVLFVVGPDFVKISLGEWVTALIALQALFADQIERNEAGGAVIGPGVQLLPFHRGVSCPCGGTAPRGDGLSPRSGRVLRLEEVEACAALFCQRVG